MTRANKPKEGQLAFSTTPGYVLDIVKDGKLVPYLKEDSQEMSESTLNAAHARTDTKATASDQKHDDDIMNDENF